MISCGRIRSVSYDFAVKISRNLIQTLDVAVDNKCSVFWKQLCKSVERVADIFQILEEVQMVFVNIQDHTDLREEAKETVRIFACFRNKNLGITDTDISTDCF